MKTPPKRRKFGQKAGFALALLGLWASGCVQSNPTAIQFIGNAVVLRQPGGGQGQLPGTCIADQSQFYRPFGTMDIMIAIQYDLFPEIANNLQPTSNVSGNLPQHLRSDASLITVQGAEVTVRVRRDNAGPYGGTGALPTATGWTRQVATDGSNTEYFTRTAYVPMTRSIRALDSKIMRFPAIPPEFGEDLRKAWFTDASTNYPDRYTTSVPVIVSFQVEGKMADGTVVRTQAIEYPINICWGCLLYLGTTPPGVEDFDPVNIYQHCSLKQMSPPEDFTPPCLPGNDEAMPCGFYCHICQEQQSFDPIANEYGCDERFCPAPP